MLARNPRSYVVKSTHYIEKISEKTVVGRMQRILVSVLQTTISAEAEVQIIHGPRLLCELPTGCLNALGGISCRM